MQKVCKTCEVSKDIDQFVKDSRIHGGYSALCKECKKKQSFEYKSRDREKHASYSREYRIKNKESVKETQRRHYIANSEKVKAVQKEYREKNKVQQRAYRLKTFYKITLEDYNAMLAEQNNLCAICGQPSPDGKFLSVDHDHSCCPGRKSCGECVRQLLCNNCNCAIGYVKDNPDLLLRAAEYIKKHREIRSHGDA